jgi:hypothetical protein
MTMEHSDTVGKLAEALVSVQSKLKPLRRNADNPFFKSSYTDLAALSETILPLLAAEGIALVQGGDGSTLDTILLHTSGEWIRTSLPMPAESNPQKLGSSITYFRRYALAAIVGAVSEGEDDDGNAASHTPARQPSAQPPATRPAPESAARPSAPAAPPASGGSPALLSVVYLDTATGEKNGKPWTRYTAKFSDGTKASTFSATHGDTLAQAKSTGEAVYCTFEKNGNFTNLTDVRFATDAPAEDGDPF